MPKDGQNIGLGYEDSFGKLIADNTSNRLDLPSTYAISSERWDVFVDGSRVDPSSSSAFSDEASSFDLTPSSGQRVELRARERPRYVPGFTVLWGMGWYMGNALPDDAVIRIGLRDTDTNDGFYAEYRNSNGTNRAVIEKAGTKAVNASMPQSVSLQQPQIDRMRANMYGVGPFEIKKYFLGGSNDAVTNETDQLAQVGVTDSVNANEFNMHLSIELDLTNASSAATLKALSAHYTVEGDADPTVRPKQYTHQNLGGAISEGYGNDALFAIRTDPSREEVRTDLIGLEITPTAQMEVLAMAFFPGDLTFTDANFVEPLQGQAENSVLQVNGQDSGSFAYPTVDKTDPFDGTTVTVPDGRLMTSAAETSGPGENLADTAGDQQTKRTLLNDDIVLFIPVGGSGVSNASVDLLRYKTIQDW